MDVVLERIAAWEQAGLIDGPTAERLRADEQARGAALDEAPADAAAIAASPPDREAASTAAQIFGPGVAIGEMFAYLGGAFILGAYHAFLLRIVGLGGPSDARLAIGYTAAAVVLAVIAVVLRRSDARRRRAAGVMLAVAVGHAGAAGLAATDVLNIGFPWALVLGGLAATAVAIIARAIQPALTTQAALLLSLTALAAATLDSIEAIIAPEPIFGGVVRTGPDPLVLLVGSAAWWLAVAFALGLLGLAEARRGGPDPAAGRRAALTRLWAGLTAVLGLASAVTRSDYIEESFEVRRTLEPWIGDLALIVLAAILVERAFRRGASTFVYAAALALMIALSDFNFSYLATDNLELGLLVEGLILLGAGIAADRLRRRIGKRPQQTPFVPPWEDLPTTGSG